MCRILRIAREKIIDPVAAANDSLSRFEPVLNSTETGEPVDYFFDENSSSLPDFPYYSTLHGSTDT